MAIVLKQVKQNNKNNLVFHSNCIIGVMGDNYTSFLKSLSSKNIYYMDLENNFKREKVIDEILYYNKNVTKQVIISFINELGLKESFLEYTIKDLSSSEKRLLKYLIMFIVNSNIMIINEPFIDLDSFYKKKISILLKRIIRDTKKTIIIGSNNSNTIYSFCKKVLLINNDKCIYGDIIKLMVDKKLLNDYNIEEPIISKFINLAKEKKNIITYSVDIGDLIKDVYRNV